MLLVVLLPLTSQWDAIRHLVQWSPFVQVYKKQYPWIQLAGHQGEENVSGGALFIFVVLLGSFRSGGGKGTVLKKCSKMEATALKDLMLDVMKPHVPEFKSEVEMDGDCILLCKNTCHIALSFSLTSNSVR